MKLLLTSFAIESSINLDTRYPPFCEIIRGGAQDIFYRMPPISLHAANNNFIPDYSTLLLCDKIIVDESSFDLMQQDRMYLYSGFAETLRVLKHEGFVELVDFETILRTNRELLEGMVENDLRRATRWIQPLKKSVNIWSDMIRYLASFYETVDDKEKNVIQDVSHMTLNPISGIVGHIEMMERQGDEENLDSDIPPYLITTIRSYLTYINSNIIISSQLHTGFHDWADFVPFYERKFSPEQKIPRTQRKIESMQKLFAISFPEFSVKDAPTLIRILKDKRISDLRALVDEAAEGRAAFDEKFAHNILLEVFKLERKSTRYRRIISYLTLPLDLLPGLGTFAAKATEEAIGEMVDSRIRRDYRWLN